MSYPNKKILDQYTDLPVSRQRKWQLRHPEKFAVLYKRYKKKHRVGRVNKQNLGSSGATDYHKRYYLKNRETILKRAKERYYEQKTKGGDTNDE